MKLFSKILFVTSLLVASVIARSKSGVEEIKREWPERLPDVLKDVQHGIKKTSNSYEDQFDYMLNSLNHLEKVENEYQREETQDAEDMQPQQFLQDEFEDQGQDQDQQEKQEEYPNQYQRQPQQVGNQQRGFEWYFPKPNENQVDDEVDKKDDLQPQQQQQQNNQQKQGLDWTEWHYAKPGKTLAGNDEVIEEDGAYEGRDEIGRSGQNQIERNFGKPDNVEDDAEDIKQDELLQRDPTYYSYNKKKEFKDKNDGYQETQFYPYQYYGQNEYEQHERSPNQQDVQSALYYYRDQSRHPNRGSGRGIL